jgi:hypothetical protein
MRNVCCTTFDTTLVQLQQLFFKLTIGSVFLHVGFKYLMVNLKKSCWVVQELYESCKRIISQICIEVNKKYQWWREFKNKSERLYWCYCLFHIIIPFTTRQRSEQIKRIMLFQRLSAQEKKKDDSTVSLT